MRYHFDSAYEGENKDGSFTSPFSSLSSLMEISLKPGDEILLKRNSVFLDSFIHIRGIDDVKISAYGEGELPLLDANASGVWYQDYGVPLDNIYHKNRGDVSSAVLIEDSNNIRIESIHVRNSGNVEEEEYNSSLRMCRTGIAFVAKNRGTIKNSVIKNVIVSSVRGNIYDKHMNNGGIYFSCLKPDDEEKTGIPRFDGVSISDSLIHDVSRWGLAVAYTYNHDKFASRNLEQKTFEKYGNLNVEIRDVFVSSAGGDGITVMYCLSPVVEHCQCESAAHEMNRSIYNQSVLFKGRVAAAIWPWKCLGAVFSRNLAIDTKINQDGQAWDADSGDGTVYDNNFSWSNEGGAVMFCLSESVNNVFRNNVSYDDLVSSITPAGNPDALLTDNVFYKRKNIPFQRAGSDGNYEEKGDRIVNIEIGDVPQFLT